MKNTPLLLAAAFLLSASLTAQNVALQEDFSSGVPPTGWSLENVNGAASPGWIISIAGDQRAQHEDEAGSHTANNRMISSPFDLSTFTDAYLHFDTEVKYPDYMANHPSSKGDGVNAVEISLDGGVTWSIIWGDSSISANRGWATIPLSTYVGTPSLQLAFHYYGSFAQEWFVDNVTVSDDPSTPPPPPSSWIVNLPASFESLPFSCDFETTAGIIPPWMALTSIDTATMLPSIDGWCNMGQLGTASPAAHSGPYCLEMGLDPNSVNTPNIRNTMVIGLNGAGATEFDLGFYMVNHGDETHPIDGIWISQNGTDWYSVLRDWSSVYMGTIWSHIPVGDLSGFGVDVTTDFYLMFAQEDNYPYAYLDGIGIDDITAGPAVSVGPEYAITNLTAGQTATLECSNNSAGDQVIFAYSFAGSGPTNTPYGTVEMSMPISNINPIPAGANGTVSIPAAIPARIAGLTVHTQCVVLTGGGNSALSNALHMVVQ